MEKIGTKIDELPYQSRGGLTHIVNLIEYDGPILSCLKDGCGGLYLMYWLDADEFCNRWLLFEVSMRRLADYLSGHTSLALLIFGHNKLFTFDQDSEGRITQASEIRETDIEESGCGPEMDSYYGDKIKGRAMIRKIKQFGG